MSELKITIRHVRVTTIATGSALGILELDKFA
jgi:hypothetical protein